MLTDWPSFFSGRFTNLISHWLQILITIVAGAAMTFIRAKNLKLGEPSAPSRAWLNSYKGKGPAA